jgi:thioredoxin-related protein
MIGHVERVVIALVLIGVAVVVAVLLERRRPAPPTQPKRWDVPTQLDRDDFEGRDHPWLVAVFTSSTCESCEKLVPKARVLASDEVAVTEIPFQSRKDLHQRYGVDAVPTLVVADAEGVVQASFVGVPTATDLWAAVAEARTPGSSPEPDLGTVRRPD